MIVSYRDLVRKAGALQPDLVAAELVRASRDMGEMERKLIGQTVTFAKSCGLDASVCVALAMEVENVGHLDPDLRHAVILEVTDAGAVTSKFADPVANDDLTTTALVACTPAALLGMCLSSPATVSLLRSMNNRAKSGVKWNHEWFRREAFRLGALGGRPTDQVIARNALIARLDTVWSALAAECVYAMLMDNSAQLGEGLWLEAVGEPDNWMYRSWLETVRNLPWFSNEFFSGKNYAGISGFTKSLQAGGVWSAIIFDGEDLLEVISEPHVLADWFGCFSIAASGEPSYDNFSGRWNIPFLSAREGIGVLTVSAEMSERPAALLRRVQLPGLEWIGPPSGETWEEDGEVVLQSGDGNPVPIMELNDKQALDNRVFYLYDEAGNRTDFMHMVGE